MTLLFKKKVWIVVTKKNALVRWTHTDECDGFAEEGLEIHRTKRLAKGACMKDEVVKKAVISWR